MDENRNYPFPLEGYNKQIIPLDIFSEIFNKNNFNPENLTPDQVAEFKAELEKMVQHWKETENPKNKTGK